MSVTELFDEGDAIPEGYPALIRNESDPNAIAAPLLQVHAPRALMLTHAADLMKGGWRYATGLPGFFNETLSLDDAQAVLTRQLEAREQSFLTVLDKGIYSRPNSPYCRLLRHAGLNFEDVKSMVKDRGLELALSDLYEAGVYVTLDEVKGRVPIRRPGLEFPVSAMDFDNPLAARHYAASTGGSQGGGTRIDIDFDLVAHDSASLICSLEAVGVADRPVFVWRAAPPSFYGLQLILRFARIGRMPERWFAPNPPRWNRQGLQGRGFTAYTLLMSRLCGSPVPRPEYIEDADDIVGPIAEATRRGTPPVVYCIQNQAVRICLAAERAGADIRGTVFFSSGEPCTEGKAAVLARVGARAAPQYGMQEAGPVCLPCGNPAAADDMHFMSDKLAVVVRTKDLAPETSVPALFYTSLLPSASKLMLNVESGDYGVVEQRDCGCQWQRLGFSTHMHHVRSYEKLTSEGVMFLGSVLYELLEETLPACFGGGPTDYQLVEEEEDGVTRVRLVISPSVGPVDEGAVLKAFYDRMSFADWSRRHADLWRHNGTLRVERRQPYMTRVGKVLPLHVLGEAPAEHSGSSQSPSS